MSASGRWVALLRGINVGGNRVILMADLRACFEGMGFGDVATYIQSGNVVFEAPGATRAALVEQIEARLAEAFEYSARVVVRSGSEMRRVIEQAPPDFDVDAERFRCDAMFLSDALDAGEVVARLPLKDGVDRAWPGEEVVYFSRLTARAGESRLPKITSMQLYREMTVRNWRTTTRLAQMVG